MYNKTELFRQALTLVKDAGELTTYSEDTPSAALCRTWYEKCRRSVIAAAAWPSAQRTMKLPLLAERTDPLTWQPDGPAIGLTYRFQAPEDMVAPIHLVGWERFYYTGGRHIDTNMSVAYLTYSSDDDDLGRWEVGRYDATLYYLASHLAVQRTGDVNLAEFYYRRAIEVAQQAASDFANQTEEYFESIPDWVAARGYTPIATPVRYYYPFTPLGPFAGRLV